MQQEIEEAGKLVAKTEQELADEEFKREKLPIPQVTATDEDMLFTLEEKQIFRQARQQLGKSTKEELEQRTQLKGKKQQSKLEETAETARRMENEQVSTQQYASVFQQGPTAQQYLNPAQHPTKEAESTEQNYSRDHLEKEKFKVHKEQGNIQEQDDKYRSQMEAETMQKKIKFHQRYGRS